jgi:two-component system, cell cycle sensor histidine kinase and response regulator CckA
MSAPRDGDDEREPRDGDNNDGDAPILEQLFEDSPVPIAILDARGRTRRMNDAHAAFLGAFGEAGQELVHGLDDLRAVKSGHADALRRALGGEVVEYELALEPAGAAGEPDERAIFQRLLVPVRVEGGTAQALVSLLLDVSAERRAEQERDRFRERMVHAQKLESLGLLAGGVAHDFNNLLVSVLGHASLLLHSLPAESSLRRHALAIETAATRAGEVARQMLAYAGRGQLRQEHVDLSALVRETADLLRVSVPRRAELQLELAPALPLVLGDATQLRQVVLNLITNAAEALPDGEGTIVLSSGELPHQAIDPARCLGAPDPNAQYFAFLEVRDNGSGMDDATLHRIFDPFFTTKTTGRGLGLSAVLGIVRGHRGALFVESEPGGGTTMRVLLPVAERGARLRAVEGGQRTLSPTPGTLVLVVDDEPEIRTVARHMLEALGFAVQTANDGQQGLAACARTDFALVLLDMTMPGLDGSTTLGRLRARHPDLRVLLTSGYERPPDRAPFLQKPFSLSELEQAVLAALS